MPSVWLTTSLMFVFASSAETVTLLSTFGAASEISGATWITYDEAKPEVWQVPLFDRVAPTLTVTKSDVGERGFGTRRRST